MKHSTSDIPGLNIGISMIGKARLIDLPPELLDEICQYFDNVETVSNLGQTCLAMQNYVQKRAWSNFLKDRFYMRNRCTRNHYPIDALRHLTALSRNLDRRSFHARTLVEPKDLYATPMLPYGQAQYGQWESRANSTNHVAIQRRYHGHGQGHHGSNRGSHISAGPGPSGGLLSHFAPSHSRVPPDRQSIGYAPQIDSYEYTGWQWDSKKEVVAWAAGSKLVLRQVFKGKDVLRLWIGAGQSESESLDANEHYHRWFRYDKVSSTQGIDDITSINLLDYVHNPEPNEHVVVGRASGGVSVLMLDATTRMWTDRPFETRGPKVKSSSVGKSGEEVLLSAAFGDNTISLYKIDLDHQPSPLDTLGPFPTNIWSSSMVSNRLAIGFGPSTSPVKIFEVTPHGLSTEPIRTCGTIRAHCHPGERHCSVNTIIPAVNAPMLGGSPGDLFFAGRNDGDALLLDIRSNQDHAMKYSDPIDASTIYSLATMGGQKLLAGAARHSMVKVFDLRMPGRMTYYHSQQAETDCHVMSDPQFKRANGNYSLYMDVAQVERQRPTYRSGRLKESSVYSLSVPSVTSSTVYAGAEGCVIQMDAVPSSERQLESINTRHPQRPPSHPEGQGSLGWDPPRRIDRTVNLRMVDHRSGKPFHQEDLGSLNMADSQYPGLDPSWCAHARVR